MKPFKFYYGDFKNWIRHHWNIVDYMSSIRRTDMETIDALSVVTDKLNQTDMVIYDRILKLEKRMAELERNARKQ